MADVKADPVLAEPVPVSSTGWRAQHQSGPGLRLADLAYGRGILDDLEAEDALIEFPGARQVCDVESDVMESGDHKPIVALSRL
jgi:hypothetical protein